MCLRMTLNTHKLRLDFLSIAQGGCSSAQAVDDQFLFKTQFWKAHTNPKRHFLRKKLLQVEHYMVHCLCFQILAAIFAFGP